MKLSSFILIILLATQVLTQTPEECLKVSTWDNGTILWNSLWDNNKRIFINIIIKNICNVDFPADLKYKIVVNNLLLDGKSDYSYDTVDDGILDISKNDLNGTVTIIAKSMYPILKKSPYGAGFGFSIYGIKADPKPTSGATIISKYSSNLN